MENFTGNFFVFAVSYRKDNDQCISPIVLVDLSGSKQIQLSCGQEIHGVHGVKPHAWNLDGNDFMKCMGWHMETHHRNGKQENFLHCVTLQGETVIWFFELCGVYRLKPLTKVNIYPTINGLTSLGKGVAFLIILVKKVVYPKIQAQ